ncbi:uncharacterized protein LOC106780567 [Vigna radiata var. radiata]|uniref:Uncharacterized protein LOC106780567 n=1 Tax=Vigna radiata var. radiata TaxID=3916 RepID=A0A1S3W198_VIGRR|nr:uncharacterized protein LOC106780567 [Vigna radiata var. radiata]
MLLRFEANGDFSSNSSNSAARVLENARKKGELWFVSVAQERKAVSDTRVGSWISQIYGWKHVQNGRRLEKLSELKSNAPSNLKDQTHVQNGRRWEKLSEFQELGGKKMQRRR